MREDREDKEDRPWMWIKAIWYILPALMAVATFIGTNFFTRLQILESLVPPMSSLPGRMEKVEGQLDKMQVTMEDVLQRITRVEERSSKKN